MDELALPKKHDMSLIFGSFFLLRKVNIRRLDIWKGMVAKIVVRIKRLLTIFAAKNSPVFFFSTITRINVEG
jgi:hypothetical protein